MPAVAEARSEAGRRPAAPHVATWYTIRGGGDLYWRCEAPAKAIGGKVAGVPEATATECFTQPHRGGEMPWSLTATLESGERVRLSSKTAWSKFTKTRPRIVGVEADFPKHEGVAVFVRPALIRATLARAMREQGIRTVMESDDNHLADPSQNLFMRQNVDAAQQHQHAQAMASGDACVFSTRALRDAYHKDFRARFGKKGLPQMHVCRNSIPLSDWPERVERDGPLRVGFMGSPSHVWDLNFAYRALHAAHGDGCETVLIGYNPGDPDPEIPDVIDTDQGPVKWRTEASIHAGKQWQAITDRHIPWVAPSEYHRAALPLDIGLCPLVGNAFNLGKSDVKAIEYTVSGAAVVCQNNPVYNSAGWKHEENCLMAGSPDEFAAQTLRLIRDPKLRYELVSAAQEMVARYRNEDTLRREWKDALSDG